MVIGHRGYIGTVMVPMLLKGRHRVTGCDSDLYERCTFGAGGPTAAVPSLRRLEESFGCDITTNRRRFRLLVVDDLRRERLALQVDNSLSRRCSVRELDRSTELSLPATRRPIDFWRLDHNSRRPRRVLTAFASVKRSAAYHNHHGLWP